MVITADGPSAAEVSSFSMRQPDGVVLDFRVERLDLSNGGLPSAHLREHLTSGEPITVYYHVANGENVADRYTDAAETETDQHSTPTSPPTTAPTASPTSAPTQAPTPTAVATPTAAATPTATPTPVLPFHFATEPFADGFLQLTFLANAGDFTGDLYAVEQRGVVWRISADGTVDPTPFIDIHERVGCCDERGLLGLAFHPDYGENVRVFVNYTDLDGNTVVSEFSAIDDGYVDPDSERKLLGIEQPFPNHNGGMLAFGADGFLYIGTGDGGAGGDPRGNGQKLNTLLGKILRINVDKGDPYAIPADNPFKKGNSEGAEPEIWDWGMRNPWRFSFDRETNDLWIGDVGQEAHEEIDAESAGTGGFNYGWNTMEGTSCYLRSSCAQDGLTRPVAEYSHSDGCAVIGGYVYRGSTYPDLVGQYVFSDLCSGNLWAIDAADALGSGSAEPVIYGDLSVVPTSFGEDEAGELYLVTDGGQVLRLTVQ
ncbi:MAG TPA: PQQ-dependent sugar dehydrogenase [Candidatus Limnocylindria bacterium]|nr:PQQ-dependent sugar dehydrogenase [Candidatus Limnocylindria bacterium]